jgi:hypothetical protein
MESIQSLPDHTTRPWCERQSVQHIIYSTNTISNWLEILKMLFVGLLVLFSSPIGLHGKKFDLLNLNNPSYLNTLSQYNENSIQTDETAESPGGLSPEQRMEYEYANKLMQQKEKLMKGSRSLTVSQVPPINLLSDQMPYQAIYQDYIINKKSFKGKMKSSEAEASGSSISISLTDCAQAKEMEINAVTNDYSLKNCYGSEMNKVIPVPNVAYNTYSIRFTNLLEDSSDDLILNLTDHWPTILPLDDSQLRPLETCPLDMHMVLWGVTDDLIARVFKTDVSSSSFSPQYGDPIAHYFQYSLNGFTPSSLTPFAETVIQSGEYLFVPNNHVVSLKPKSNKGSEGKEKSVLKMCFFDASNVNEVRQALKVESLVSKASGSFLKQLNSPSSFDFAMVREPPTELTVNQFLVYPKPTEESSVKRIEGLDSTSNRRNRGKGDYKGLSLSPPSLLSHLSLLSLPPSLPPSRSSRLARNFQMELPDLLSHDSSATCPISHFHWTQEHLSRVAYTLPPFLSRPNQIRSQHHCLSRECSHRSSEQRSSPQLLLLSK